MRTENSTIPAVNFAVAEVAARLNDEKRTSVSRAQSSWAGVGDEVAVVAYLLT